MPIGTKICAISTITIRSSFNLQRKLFSRFVGLKIIVAQVGAREHYAVARALHCQGLLAGLVTDWYAPGRAINPALATSAERGFAGGAKATAPARSQAIPNRLVRTFPMRSLFWKWRVRQMSKQNRAYEAYVQTDRAFALATARLPLPRHDLFYGYSYASMEMLEAEKQRGVLTVLDQIDPGADEFRLVAEEMRRHPDLAGAPPGFPTAYYERNRREWEMADIIVVNSTWSREALVRQGVAAEKLVVVPLAYEMEPIREDAASPTGRPAGPLQVLWLGQVNVRKGIHYLMEGARILQRKAVHFHVVGPVAISAAAVKQAPANMTFHGRVPRDQTAHWFRRSDVFVLPTLSDGFALTQLEAMAHGLPVIATPNCGDVVTDGVDGFVIAPRNAECLAEAIQRYAQDRLLLAQHRQAAPKKCAGFTIAKLSERLLPALSH